MKQKKEPTRWHIYLAELLQLLLTPHGVTVETEPEVMGNPPRADIILIRREGDHWTEAQRAYLPDGIRDTNASHILIEFKKTESLSADAVIQIASYDIQLRENRRLAADGLSSFLICAIQPRRANLEALGFVPSEMRGVYDNAHPLAKRTTLISLNELPNEQHNLFVALFASRQKRLNEAVKLVQRDHPPITHETNWFLNGLLRNTLKITGANLMEQPTVEELKAIGRQMYFESMARSMTPELMAEFLMTPGVMSDTTSEQILEHVSAEQLLKKFPPERLLEIIPPEERLAGLEPEERLAGLTSEEREYLRKLLAGDGKDISA